MINGRGKHFTPGTFSMQADDRAIEDRKKNEPVP
jgi:hypothetical protein